MKEIVYLDGSWLPIDQAKVSALDYGFLYGYGLFETMRAYEGQVFRLESHLDRLGRSAAALGINIDPRELTKAVEDTLRVNGLKNARVRVAVSAGEGSVAPDVPSCPRPTVLVLATSYKAHPEAVYERGFRAVVSSIRRNSQSPLSRIKSANYLESLLAKREAKAAGADEALFLNEKGLLCEASMSNVFLVKESTLLTPREASGILPGITRQAAMELAAKLGILVGEKDLTLEAVYQADEAFLTNSLIEVMPLIKVDGQDIASGRPGVITRKLMKAYQDLVAAGE